MTLCTAPKLSSSILNILSKDGKNIEKLMLPYLLTFIISDFGHMEIVKLREREGQRVDLGRSLKGHL